MVVYSVVETLLKMNTCYVGYIENTLIWKQGLQDLRRMVQVHEDYSNSKLPPGLLDIANLFVVDLI